MSNVAAAIDAWGQDLPEWIRMLADECDRTTQADVAERLKISGSYVNRLIHNRYGASHTEPEQMVLAIIGGRKIECPAFGPIPLTSCIRNRRRTGPATNMLQRAFERHCPACPFNTDRKHGEAR
jgi:predicted YcjX-like family ATPase